MSVVGARATSAGVNHATDRRVVFRRGGPTSAPRYAALVAAILAANWALMHSFVVVLGAGLLLAKLVTEGLLLFVSYAVQHRFVFARRYQRASMTSNASSSRWCSDPRNPLATCAPTAVRTAAIATRAPSAGRRSWPGSVPVRR